MMYAKLMASIGGACYRKRCAGAEKGLTRRAPDESNYLDIKQGFRLTDHKGLAQILTSVTTPAILLAVFLSMIPLSYSQEEGATDSAESDDTVVEEVIVYGIRQSLENALEEKRETTNLIEVINAEDIGKLPDENVAEVLENIPGVQIGRSAGIGASVSIRGSEDNRVEINGRGTTPSGDSRGGMSFADLPAALVRSLNVVKVPTADMIEGSVGGTINVKTSRGLQLRAFSSTSRYL